jgi:OOP family OmpA-OmpF porin
VLQIERLKEVLRRRRGALGVLISALSGCLLSANEAEAQSDYFYLDRAQISGAPDDGFMVWRPKMYEVTRFYGQAALGYTQNPLRDTAVTDDPATREAIDNPVQGQLILYLNAGVQVANRASFNLSLPITAYKFAGEDPQGAGVGTGGIGDNPVAAHDLRFDARVKVFENDRRNVRIGVGGVLFAPTGNSGAFAGDDGLSGYLLGMGDVDFGKFFLSGNLGPHFKPERSIGGEEGDLYTGTELRWAFGGYVPLREDKLRIGAELWGTTGLVPLGPEDESSFFKGKNTDIEWLAQARMLVDRKQQIWAMGGFGTRLATGYGAPDFRILVSIGYWFTLKDVEPPSPPPKVKVIPDVEDYEPDRDGDGYPDAVDKCPDEKEDGKPPAPTDGCPASSDRDKDGIPDNVDQCPDKPEDKDGVQDQDGCPEEDVDNDKIPDAEDKCPTEPGPRNKIAEKNGCPTLTRVNESGEVEILQPIEFEFGKAVIKPGSYPILDEVVTLMESRPEYRVGVYGHTDNRGAMALNMRLSKERAAACKNYLINKGIAASRLESEGFGPNKPVTTNDTDEGRAKNRRVEFKILSGAN